MEFCRKPFRVYGKIPLKPDRVLGKNAENVREFSNMDKGRISVLIKELDGVTDPILLAIFRSMNLKPERKKKTERSIRLHIGQRRRETIKGLRGLPDEKFQEALDTISFIRGQVRKMLMQAAKAIPKGKGGRPKNLNPAARQRAIAEISALHQTGGTISRAIAITADHFKVKQRYMQNVWENREEFSKGT